MTQLLITKSPYVWKKLGGWGCGSEQAPLNIELFQFKSGFLLTDFGGFLMLPSEVVIECIWYRSLYSVTSSLVWIQHVKCQSMNVRNRVQWTACGPVYSNVLI